MIETNIAPTAKTWDFENDNQDTYTIEQLNAKLETSLGVTVSAEQFKAIAGTDAFVSDTELYAIEGGSSGGTGDGMLTLNEFNKDTDAAVTTTPTVVEDGVAEEWDFDTEDNDGKDSYTFDELKTTLEGKFKVTVDVPNLITALKQTGWVEGQAITDDMLRSLEGNLDDGILTLDELKADSDKAVVTTVKKTLFNYGKDTKINNNTVYSLAAELEAVLGTDVDERGLAKLLGLKSLDQTFNDALIKNRLDINNRNATTLTMAEISTIQTNAAREGASSTLKKQNEWDYNADKKTEYTKTEFDALIKKLGVANTLVDTNSEIYKKLFKNNSNATDQEITAMLDTNKDGVIARGEAERVITNAGVSYINDGKNSYATPKELADSIFKSLHGTLTTNNVSKYNEILESVNSVFTGPGPITDAQIMASALDNNKNGLIDTWVTDNNPNTKPVVVTPVKTTATAK